MKWFTMPMPGPDDWGSNSSACWSDDSEVSRDSVLLASVAIGAALFHMQAIRVVVDDDGAQVAEDAAFAEDLLRAQDLCGTCGNLDTTRIPGHEGEYVITIVPFER